MPILKANIRRRMHLNRHFMERGNRCLLCAANARPYLAGGILVDYLVRGRFLLMSEHPPVLTLDNLTALTGPLGAVQNPDNAGAQVPSSANGDSAETQSPVIAHSGLKEIKVAHE